MDNWDEYEPPSSCGYDDDIMLSPREIRTRSTTRCRGESTKMKNVKGQIKRRKNKRKAERLARRKSR